MSDEVELHDPKYTDKHVLKSYTNSVNRNIESIIQYTKETRKMLRELEKAVKALRAELNQKNAEIQSLNARIAQLQVQRFSGGPTTV